MTHSEIMKLMNELELPYAYDHFAEGESPEPPFIVFLYPNSNNFAADGKVYYKINQIHIEIYTDLKDVELETKVETVFDRHGIFYEKSETWIDSEQLYEILYQFETEGTSYDEEE